MDIKAREIVFVPISEIKLNPKNRNKHPKDQIDQLAVIIRYQGFRDPVTISKLSGYLIAGEGRYLAAKKLGATHIPTIYQDFANADQEYAYGISNNAIASWSDLDLSMINLDLPDLGPFDISLLGIKDFVVEPLDKLEPEVKDQEDENEKFDHIPEKIEPRTEAGNQFRIGSHKLSCSDCLEFLKTLESDSCDSLLSDVPAGISFMNKKWDDNKGGRDEWIKWLSEVMKEALRVLKPGAHGLVWSLPRTSHWTASALEDAGFEIRDVITHVFGSGFPKSLDVSKTIDKAAGVEREVIGENTKAKQQTGQKGTNSFGDRDQNLYITAPSTDAAKQWSGYGTALKPASENWILVRKPLSADTVAENVLKYGCGAINIDASRVASNTAIEAGRGDRDARDTGIYGKYNGTGQREFQTQGRWPSNFILSHNSDCVEVGTKEVKGSNDPRRKDGILNSGGIFGTGESKREVTNFNNIHGTETVSTWECTEGCAVAELDGQSGNRDSRIFSHRGLNNKVYSQSNKQITPQGYTDSGGASRFFYCAKPSRSEKNEGLDGMPEVEMDIGDERPSGNSWERRGRQASLPRANHHPTVKSIALMTYLARMITPQKGIVLDPFAGSGTTLVICEKLGFTCYASEMNPEYCDIILARLEHVSKQKAELING